MIPTAQQQERMARLGVQAGDLREEFRRSRGPGGQHVNKVETGVTLVHGPTGLRAVCEDSRSRAANRRLALDRLLDKMEAARAERRHQRLAEAAKLRRQRARRSSATKAKMRQAKVRRAQIKGWRRGPTGES